MSSIDFCAPFYHKSKWGHTVPADKFCLTGGLGTSGSVISYDLGINGINIIFHDTPSGFADNVTASDFVFKVSDSGFNVDNDFSTWATGIDPTGVEVTETVGSPSTGIVKLMWDDNINQERWLEVTVKANDNTGLGGEAKLYLGSKIGDVLYNTVGTGSFLTSAADEIAIRDNPGFGQPITNPHDINRDGVVSAIDQLAARDNFGFIKNIVV